MENEKKLGRWKGLMATELTAKMKDYSNFYVSDYLGLTADDIGELRRELEAGSSRFMVIKNTIAKLALDNIGLGELKDLINGGTGITLCGDDAIAPVRILSKFSKSHGFFKIRGGYVDGNKLDAARVAYLASLPGKKELVGKLVCGLKSPISGFVGVLGNTIKSLVYALNAVKVKRGG